MGVVERFYPRLTERSHGALGSATSYIFMRAQRALRVAFLLLAGLRCTASSRCWASRCWSRIVITLMDLLRRHDRKLPASERSPHPARHQYGPSWFFSAVLIVWARADRRQTAYRVGLSLIAAAPPQAPRCAAYRFARQSAFRMTRAPARSLVEKRPHGRRCGDRATGFMSAASCQAERAGIRSSRWFATLLKRIFHPPGGGIRDH